MFREQVENVCDTGRVVAPTADKFRELLMSKTFTNAKTDHSLVLGLYQGFLREGFGSARRLTYGSLGWVDAEMALLAQVHGMRRPPSPLPRSFHWPSLPDRSPPDH